MDSPWSPCGLLEMLDVVLLKSMKSPQRPHGESPWSPHGVCENMWGSVKYSITDRDARWKGEFWKEICKKMGMTRSLTTAYHPQADGQTDDMTVVPIWSEQPHYKHHSIRLKVQGEGNLSLAVERGENECVDIMIRDPKMVRKCRSSKR